MIWLLQRNLRARDEAPRQSSEAPCDVSQAAWRGVDARERAGHNRACESACRLEPRSLLRCRVALRARARRWRCDGAWGHDDGSPDRPTDEPRARNNSTGPIRGYYNTPSPIAADPSLISPFACIARLFASVSFATYLQGKTDDARVCPSRSRPDHGGLTTGSTRE